MSGGFINDNAYSEQTGREGPDTEWPEEEDEEAPMSEWREKAAEVRKDLDAEEWHWVGAFDRLVGEFGRSCYLAGLRAAKEAVLAHAKPPTSCRGGREEWAQILANGVIQKLIEQEEASE